MDSLADLLEDEVKDLYSAENQLIKALPKMTKKATSKTLKEAFTMHLAETRGHVERLQKVGGIMGIKLGGKKCKAMEGLVEEGKEIIEEDGEGSVIDTGLIGAAQRVEHYEMAGYGCAREMAHSLGMSDVAALLQETLNEEMAADKKLTKIARSEVLKDAAAAGEEEEEEEDDE
jgi:ferritin-like metal-binding protein YciE